MTTQNIPDAHSPLEIAQLVESVGVKKAKTDTVTLFALAVLAGAFISVASLFFLVAVTNSQWGFGPTRLLGGLSFCLGLVLVVIAGAELFTGNNLIAMAWASRLITGRDVLRNWVIVYLGNVVGSLGTVLLAVTGNLAKMDSGAFGKTALDVAIAKSDLPVMECVSRGLLCNALVCMAVWLTLGGRSVTDKIMAIIFPVTAFVALGLEHSIANWFFLPYALALDTTGAISYSAVARNLIAVTVGNIIGGTLLVAGVYWVAYLRASKHDRCT